MGRNVVMNVPFKVLRTFSCGTVEQFGEMQAKKGAQRQVSIMRLEKLSNADLFPPRFFPDLHIHIFIDVLTQRVTRNERPNIFFISTNNYTIIAQVRRFRPATCTGSFPTEGHIEQQAM